MADTIIVVYSIAELLLAVQISLSNLLVLWVYFRSSHVRTPTNAFIFSLALVDFLAGAIGIPFTVFSVLTRAPHSFVPCLTVHILMCIFCTISIFHLLAIAIDKYMTICCKCQFVHQHSRNGRAMFLIIMAWIFGTGIAILPLFDAFGFASNTIKNWNGECHFTTVVDYRYLVYVIFFGTIIIPSLIIIFCYTSIYSRIRYEEKQITVLLRASERQRRMNNRRKLIRILLILVITYAVCWYPLYFINTIDLYFPEYHSTVGMTLFTVVLSHFGCAVNPIIYAYGMPGFKQALRKFFKIGDIHCKTHFKNNYNSTFANCSCLTPNNVYEMTIKKKAIRSASTKSPIMMHKRSHVHFADMKRKISEPPTLHTSIVNDANFSPIRIIKSKNGFETREYCC